MAQTLRKAQLDCLYTEMITSCLAHQNHQYNLNHNALLSIELIMARILRWATLSTMVVLWRTSKSLGLLMLSIVKRFPVTSVRIERLCLFGHALIPFLYKGALLKHIARTVTTIRLKIRNTGSSKSHRDRYTIGDSIKRIIVNVVDRKDLQWFKESFCLSGQEVIIYHEKPAFSDYYLRLSCTPHKDREELVPSIVDQRGLLFDALPNFTNTIESQ